MTKFGEPVEMCFRCRRPIEGVGCCECNRTLREPKTEIPMYSNDMDEFTRRRWDDQNNSTKDHKPIEALQRAIDLINKGEINPSHILICIREPNKHNNPTVPGVGYVQSGDLDAIGQIGLAETIAKQLYKYSYGDA